MLNPMQGSFTQLCFCPIWILGVLHVTETCLHLCSRSGLWIWIGGTSHQKGKHLRMRRKVIPCIPSPWHSCHPPFSSITCSHTQQSRLKNGSPFTQTQTLIVLVSNHFVEKRQIPQLLLYGRTGSKLLKRPQLLDSRTESRCFEVVEVCIVTNLWEN